MFSSLSVPELGGGFFAPRQTYASVSKHSQDRWVRETAVDGCSLGQVCFEVMGVSAGFRSSVGDFGRMVIPGLRAPRPRKAYHIIIESL